MRRTTALYGIMITLALIASYVESLVPLPIPVPGIKLGLANVVTLSALILMGSKAAFFISVARIVLAGFLFGNLSAILYSLSGGLVSLGVMALCHRSGKFSIIGISIAGGVSHNIGQLCMAALVVWNTNLFYYLPVLLIAGAVTGILIGMVDQEILKRISGKERYL